MVTPAEHGDDVCAVEQPIEQTLRQYWRWEQIVEILGFAIAGQDQAAAKLDALFAQFSEFVPRNIGYPCNEVFDYSELFRFLQFAANNVGDPFAGSNYRLNTHEFECEVLRDFAKLARAPNWRRRSSSNTWWTTSCRPTVRGKEGKTWSRC